MFVGIDVAKAELVISVLTPISLRGIPAWRTLCRQLHAA